MHKFTHVSRNHAAPERDVDRTLAGRGSELFFKCVFGSSSGNRVKRHVDDRRYTTRGRSSRRSFVSFPFRAAGLVDMNVTVDDSWHDDEISKVDQLGATWSVGPFTDLKDLSVLELD